MELPNIAEVTTAEQAREIAIDWQHNTASEPPMFYSELAEYGAYFQELADQFELVEEFKENGII